MQSTKFRLLEGLRGFKLSYIVILVTKARLIIPFLLHSNPIFSERKIQEQIFHLENCL